MNGLGKIQACCGGLASSGLGWIREDPMARFSMRIAPMAVLAATAFIPGIFGVLAPQAAVTHDAPAAVSARGSGQQLWVHRYNGPGNGSDGARAMAVSPDGNTVFVAGASAGSSSGNDYALVAYRAATGAQLWVKRYNGRANGDDVAVALAVSPGGSTVFVTGYSRGTTSGYDYATVAYRASTGKMLWAKRYNGPASRADTATSLAVSSAAVFVTGSSTGTDHVTDYATVAYRATTGTQLWARRYHGPGVGSDSAQSVTVNSSGTRVFVTGGSNGTTTHTDYATLAYRASTGARLWVTRYNSPGARYGYDEASAMAINRAGTVLYVTGDSHAAHSGGSYTTVAYRTSTGARLWANRYNGADGPAAIAVNPSGTSVFVTGTRNFAASSFYFVTVAYNATTGIRTWVDRYAPEGGGIANSLAVSPDGSKVFVTGFTTGLEHGKYATIAYRATAGARLWTADYIGPADTGDAATAVAATSTTVFVTGDANVGPHSDYATIAYTP
jgi:PQQ-like domain